MEPFEPKEIQDRVRLRFLERLQIKLRELRGHLVRRQWSAFEATCRQIADGARNFGFTELSVHAHSLVQQIRAERPSPHSSPVQLRSNCERFLQDLDQLISERLTY